MSREEFNIDKVFREVAHKHQEAYDAQDWNAFQTQLQSAGLQAKPSMVSQVIKYITKFVATSVLVYMLPASNPVVNTPTQSKPIATIEEQATEANIAEKTPIAQKSTTENSTSKQKRDEAKLRQNKQIPEKTNQSSSTIPLVQNSAKSPSVSTQKQLQQGKVNNPGVVQPQGSKRTSLTPGKSLVQRKTGKPLGIKTLNKQPNQNLKKVDKNKSKRSVIAKTTDKNQGIKKTGGNNTTQTKNTAIAKKPVNPMTKKSDTGKKAGGKSNAKTLPIRQKTKVASKNPIVSNKQNTLAVNPNKQPNSQVKNTQTSPMKPKSRLPIVTSQKQRGNKLTTSINEVKVTYPMIAPLTRTQYSLVKTDSGSHPEYLASNMDSIQYQGERNAVKAYWEAKAWSQRPRNVFEKVGRWMKILPDHQKIAQKQAKEAFNTKSVKPKGSEKTLAKNISTKKTAKTSRLRPKKTKKKAKKNRFLGITMPKVKLGKFLNRFFTARVKDTTQVAKSAPTKYPIKEFHAGFVFPLSTNGTQAYDYSNRLSIHALLGGAAALDGTEFSGFGNIEKDYVKGAQFAGFFNTVGNSVQGVQAAGFFNNAGNLQGAQLAGFLNMSGVVKSKKSRLTPKVAAVQAAGFGNLNFSDDLRFQGAGFFNIGNKVKGFQGAGFFNVGRDVTGFQGSGFMGIAEKVKGAQISGFMNIAEQAEGLQMAGFLNLANHVKGYQIGFLNIADSVSNGIPIGFLSIVKNGYRRLEVSTNESLFTNVGYKIGVKKFYNIFAVGGQFLPQNIRWGVGYGIGSIRDLSANRQLSIEAMVYHINENKFWEERFRMLNQVKFLFGSSKRNSWHFGPTLNLLFSQDVPERGLTASEFPLYQLVNSTNNGRNTKFWVGFQAGIRF